MSIRIKVQVDNQPTFLYPSAGGLQLLITSTHHDGYPRWDSDGGYTGQRFEFKFLEDMAWHDKQLKRPIGNEVRMRSGRAFLSLEDAIRVMTQEEGHNPSNLHLKLVTEKDLIKRIDSLELSQQLQLLKHLQLKTGYIANETNNLSRAQDILPRHSRRHTTSIAFLGSARVEAEISDQGLQSTTTEVKKQGSPLDEDDEWVQA